MNTGGPPNGIAAEMVRRYAPDQKMIAIPKRETLLLAYMGNVWRWRFVRMLFGPLPDVRQIREARGSGSFIPTGLARPITLVMAILALSLWAIPFRQVALSPSRAIRWIERLVPGVGHPWGWSGALALLAWSVLILTVVAGWTLGIPYNLVSIMQTWLLRAFALPPEALPEGPRFWDDVNPPFTILAAAVVAMTVANYLVVRRAQHRLGQLP